LGGGQILQLEKKILFTNPEKRMEKNDSFKGIFGHFWKKIKWRQLDLGYYLLPRLLVNSRTFENRLHCPFEGWAADWWILPGALNPGLP